MRQIPLERFAGHVPTPFAVYRVPFAGAATLPSQDLGVGHLDGAPLTFTPDQFQALMLESATAGATAAIKSVNAVDPNDRPGASKAIEAPNFNRQRPVRLSLGRMMHGALTAKSGWRPGYELERDFSQATKDIYLSGSDSANDDSVCVPTTPLAYADVLDQASIRTESSPQLKEWSVKALSESVGGVNSVSYGNTVGAALVPPQFLQDEFVLALTSAVALRNAPGVRSMPVNSNIIQLPRENTVATATSAAEAAALSSSDPAFATQAFTIQKQYGYRTYSNELLKDSNPGIDQYIARTLVRDIALFQDLQYLEGAGTGTNLQGIKGYTGLTTSSFSAAANGSTPTGDQLIAMVYDIRKANTEPNAWIMHPRTLQNIQLLKDNVGRYLFSDQTVWGAPDVNPAAGTGFTYPSAAVGRLLGYPVFLSSQISITQTQGTSSAASYLILGNFNYCLILERQALEIATSDQVAFNSAQPAVRGIARSALALTQPKAFTTPTGIV